MKAYKGFLKFDDGSLRGMHHFQFEEGKTYTFDKKPIVHKRGFHASHTLCGCWCFYPNDGNSVFYEVECGGTIVENKENDGTIACTEIKLIKPIDMSSVAKFDNCGQFHDGYTEATCDNKRFKIDTEGRIIEYLEK